MKFPPLAMAACLVLTAWAAVPAFAAETLSVQVPAGVDPAAPIPTAVKNECGLEMLLGNYALSAMARNGVAAQAALNQEKSGSNKYVQLTVLSVHGFGGGSWSGSKSMSIRVDVKQGDAIVGTTVLSRSSGGGFLGGFKGTCTILDRVAKALGNDVGRWVARSSASTSTGQPAAAASAGQAADE